jgi:hypothetical protein
MNKGQTKQTLKLRLLAIVLTMALIWYSLNPMPAPTVRRNRDEELPDEKKRNLEPDSMPATLSIAFSPFRKIAEPLSSIDEDEDDFEWPEFIDG